MIDAPQLKCLFRWIAILGYIVLPSCALNVQPPKTYQLTTVSQQKANLKSTSKDMLVSMPQAAAGYEGINMLYKTQDYQLASFTHNIWNAPPNEMLQPLIVKSLQNSGYFRAVVPAPNPATTNLRLDVTLIKLQQNFTQKPSYVEMVVNATLTDDQTFTAVASQSFSATVPADMDNPYGGVVAANGASLQILEALTQWTVTTSANYLKKS